MQRLVTLAGDAVGAHFLACWLSDVNARKAFEEVLRIQLALARIAYGHSCRVDPFTLRTAVSLVLKSISSSQRPLLMSDPIVRRMLEEIQVYDVHLDQEIAATSTRFQ